MQFYGRENKLKRLKGESIEILKTKERPNGEFDVVTLDEKEYAFYEVKFRNRRTSNAVIEE